MQALEEVIRKYPNTEYAATAKRKIEMARDQLAGKEMEIGRYYLKQGDFTGAINRFKVVVTQYQTTRHVEEALMRLTEAYLALGIVSEAQTAAAVLGHNFPDSRWYKDAYALVQSGGLEPRREQGLLDQPGVQEGRARLTASIHVPHVSPSPWPGLSRQSDVFDASAIGANDDAVFVRSARLDRTETDSAHARPALDPRHRPDRAARHRFRRAALAVLTGETGAGKSILLDAFALALGARGDAALVRHGAEQGQVTAAFELPARPSGARAAGRERHRRPRTS